jgi:hypothetical protein
MKSELAANTQQAQQYRLIARNARQVGNVIKGNYPTAAIINETKPDSCHGRGSADEILSCVWSEMTKVINDTSHGEDANEIQALAGVSS